MTKNLDRALFPRLIWTKSKRTAAFFGMSSLIGIGWRYQIQYQYNFWTEIDHPLSLPCSFYGHETFVTSDSIPLVATCDGTCAGSESSCYVLDHENQPWDDNRITKKRWNSSSTKGLRSILPWMTRVRMYALCGEEWDWPDQ